VCWIEINPIDGKRLLIRANNIVMISAYEPTYTNGDGESSYRLRFDTVDGQFYIEVFKSEAERDQRYSEIKFALSGKESDESNSAQYGLRRIYIVECRLYRPETQKWTTKISYEGYTSLFDAQAFVMSRSNNPQKVSDFYYQTGALEEYYIREIVIKNKTRK
jgi:hypothetical protein